MSEKREITPEAEWSTEEEKDVQFQAELDKQWEDWFVGLPSTDDV